MPVVASVSEVDRLLQRLGEKTPEEIAQILMVEGIKGKVGDACESPISRLIQKKTGWNAEVGDDCIWLSYKHGPLAGWASVELPDNVAEFIFRFNYGEFPELEDEDEHEGAS